jgi:hypothetical protein
MRLPLRVAALRALLVPLAIGTIGLAGASVLAPESTVARAEDDAGMMAFLLRDNARPEPARVWRFAAPAAQPRVVHFGPALAYPPKIAARTIKMQPHVKRSAKAAKAPVAQKPAPAPLPPSRSQLTQRPVSTVLHAAERARFKDPTLRRGDIVATSRGLQVFLGGSRFPYAESDFALLSKSRDGRDRSGLAAIDRALRMGGPGQSAHRIRLASAATPASEARLAVARPVGALAYAPMQVRAETPALRAIDRAVRASDGKPARKPVASDRSRSRHSATKQVSRPQADATRRALKAHVRHGPPSAATLVRHRPLVWHAPAFTTRYAEAQRRWRW